MSRRHRPAVGGSVLLLALALLLGTSGAFPTHRTASADDDERSRVLYLLLVDTSVSMRDKPEGRDEPKMATVRKVLGEFMKSLPSETDVYLATFNQGIQREWRRRVLGDADREALGALVAGMRPVGSKTFAWPSLAEMLKKAQAWLDQNKGGEVRLFVYTDGEDNSGTQLETVLAPYRDLLTSEDVRASFYTLGFTLRMGLPEALERIGIRVRAVPDLSDLAPPLTASFDWSPSRPAKGTRVLFRDRSTGWIKGYAWDFGDGSTSSDKAPAHAFEKEGTYTVTLRVTDSTGQKDDTERKIVILPPADPKVDFVIGTTSPEMGRSVTLVERCEGEVSDFRWDFGDGTSGSGPTVEHAWSKAGEYSVTLSVKGPGGKRFTSKPRSVHIVAPAAPKVELVVPQEGVPLGTTLRFIADVEGQIHDIQWDFGDGTTSTEQFPEHKYTSAGEYTVKLTVSGPGGTQTTDAKITVLPPKKPVASFSVGTTEPRVDQDVTFTNTSTGTVDGAVWDFGDGSGPKEGFGAVSHRYTKPGTYTVELTVRGAGAQDEASQTIEVVPSNAPPQADFSWHLAKTYGAMDVRFENLTTGSAAGFTWTFGAGTDPVQTKEHGDLTKAMEPGEYEVTLVAHGAAGFADSRVTKTVEVPHPPGFFAKYWWALLIGAIVGFLAVRKIAKDAQEKREAIESTWITGTLEVLDEDSGDWNTLGSSEYGEPTTELSVPADILGEAPGGTVDRVVIKADGDAYVAEVYAGGHGSPVARVPLSETMPGSTDYEGSWDRFLFRFRS